MTEQEIKQLALDIRDNKIFGSWAVPAHSTNLLGMIFMPLVLGAEIPQDVIHVYEYMDKAGPRSINGYPIFFSLLMITKDDYELLVPIVKNLVKQDEEFMGKGETDADGN